MLLEHIIHPRRRNRIQHEERTHEREVFVEVEEFLHSRGRVGLSPKRVHLEGYGDEKDEQERERRFRRDAKHNAEAAEHKKDAASKHRHAGARHAFRLRVARQSVKVREMIPCVHEEITAEDEPTD